MPRFHSLCSFYIIGISLDGINTFSHYFYYKGSSDKTYKFFFTCLLSFCPISVQTKLSEGIDRISCKCFAPLFRHLNISAGRGTLIKLPLRSGLFETTFILRSYAA